MTALRLNPVVLPLAAMAMLWTVVPALVHTAPPLDVVESALWGCEWVVGTYKHPNMPGWVIEAGRWLHGGTVGWPAYAASQLFNLATLTLTFLLARDLADVRVAMAAVLALLGVEYFSWRAVEFNHTIAQTPFWVGAGWCAWRAATRGQLLWWLALGAMAALGLYAKLSNAMLLLVIAGWILSSPAGRATLRTPGPWLGAAAFAVLCWPLAQWLLASQFQALTYASERGRDQSLLATLLFPMNALLQAAPIGLALALAGFFQRPKLDTRGPTPLNPDALRFLWVIAVVPPALSIVLALLGGSGLRAAWLAPALPLLTVLLVALLQRRLTDPVLTRLGQIGVGLAVIVPLVYAVVAPRLERLTGLPPLRVSWPQAEIAKALSSAWASETGKPLKIVAGTSWAAGLVGINHPDRPSILTEGQLAFSPWITPERLRQQGALAVWIDGRGAIATPALDALMAGRPVNILRIPRQVGQQTRVLTLRYAILPPA